jgi:hypothetical protein
VTSAPMAIFGNDGNVIILRIGGQWVSFNEQELRDVQKFAEEYFAAMEGDSE